jgi:hypothetical protein
VAADARSTWQFDLRIFSQDNELPEEGIDIVKVDTMSNLADILTKCLSNLEYNVQTKKADNHTD